MDLIDFISGKHVKQIEYKSFSPEKINHEWIGYYEYSQPRNDESI